MTVNPFFLPCKKYAAQREQPTAELMKNWSKITISRYHKILAIHWHTEKKPAKNNPRKNEIKSLFLASRKA
jgi:hypothetical protein